MFTLIRNISIKQFLIEQVPAFLLALITAEAFYKFHSFTLECLSFLATWFITDAVLTQFYKFLVHKGLINDEPLNLTEKSN